MSLGRSLAVALLLAAPGWAAAEWTTIASTEKLAAYKAPKVIYMAKEFPRTRNGKILRRDISPQIALSRSR